ncbi:uncharacterized protein LOC112511305 [Cynara cardunculus var. scolymus]|uniref:Uncharacterized protein n=1 Tax=Cynara cardunculus var. scolymus TaxID=59895 RepID=A0A118JYU0_CYNCS|nr:uncharacterized protein LOC112511305 [Cynara cardunculus var. scolymus]KVH98607.1 hypothetical protein Ccrd_023168 [Cynara cardunculus var. scolymus]
MLLAVEGGGFFSSSASGYSKGLTLLLLGKKTEEKPMRVTPWNQYQLVDQESDPDLQLASHKNHLVRGCASFLCFGRTAAGLETPSPLKVGPAHHQNQEDVLKSSPDLQNVKENDRTSDLVDDNDNINSINASSLRSSLKRPTTGVSVSDACDKEDEGERVDRNDANGLDHTERRVQWTDVSGGELFVIREFEASEHSGSDDEYENGNERSCSCRLM